MKGNAKRFIAWISIAFVLFVGCNDGYCLGEIELDPNKEIDRYEIVDFVSNDGAKHVRMVRYEGVPDRQIMSHYTLVRFAFADLQTSFCSTTELEYQNTLHNWDDTAFATYRGEMYEVQMTQGGVVNEEPGWSHALTIKEAHSGDVLVGPIALNLVQCLNIRKDDDEVWCGWMWAYEEI